MNETAQVNMALRNELMRFDPYKMGIGFYETEMADTVAAVHQYEEPRALAAAIRRIYEHSFDEPVPGGDPVELAEKLLSVKNTTCSL